MTKIVTIDDNEIKLNTNLNEMAFGKTKFSSIVTHKGLLAEAELSANGIYSFSFNQWNFEDVKALKLSETEEAKVHFCGANPLSKEAESLSAILNKESISAKDFKSVYAVVSALTQIISQNIEAPYVGGSGIIIDITEKKAKILILPEELFENSIFSLSKEEFAEQNECWLNKNLRGTARFIFQRASIVYKLLTGRLPYAQTDITERNADLLDKKFLPLNLCISLDNQRLFDTINKDLSEGKNTSDFSIMQIFELMDEINVIRATSEGFEEKASEYLKRQNKKINAKRNLRRNTASLITGIIVLITVIIVAISMKNSKNDKFTTQGLSSTQTVEGFLKGMNDQNCALLEEITKGHEIKKYVDVISQIFVTSTQRTAYNFDRGISAPEKWVFNLTDEASIDLCEVYGFSNVRIDGHPYYLNSIPPRKKNASPAIHKENDLIISDGDVIKHRADYYMLYANGGEHDVNVEYIESEIVTTFVKNRWMVTGLNILNNTAVTFDSADFYNAYISEYSKTKNTLQTVNNLRTEFQWLPEEKAILYIQKQLVQ